MSASVRLWESTFRNLTREPVELPVNEKGPVVKTGPSRKPAASGSGRYGTGIVSHVTTFESGS